MPIESNPFGQIDGHDIFQFTLTNNHGMTAKLINLGCVLTELHVPGRDDQLADVVLGYDNLASYELNPPSFGAVCGRVIGRIAGGRFTIDGNEYQLPTNCDTCCLHGGPAGFSKRIYTPQVWESEEGPVVQFTMTSPDGDQGFPGNLKVTVTFTLTHDNALVEKITATTDKPTPVMLANHSYFNLAGHASGPVVEQTLQIHSSRCLPLDDQLMPTGELRPVTGTHLDFTEMTAIGNRITEAKAERDGYDISFILDGEPGQLNKAAHAIDPVSGRTLEVSTTKPIVHLYTANYLENEPGKGGAMYGQWDAFCLECQAYANAVNTPALPNNVLQPGETYDEMTVFKFGVV